MKFKKTFLLICLIVCLFTMASVCASDANDTVIDSKDTGEIELSASDDVATDNLEKSEENVKLTLTDNDETVGAQSDTEVLSTNSGNYSGLALEISNGGTHVRLEHDYYTYDQGSTINIGTPNCVIDGNGAIIDMDGSTIQAFYVGGSGITIKNLTIKNANYEGYGGAIYFSKSCTVENCNFTNNKATGNHGRGGAVYFLDECTVTNCSFTNNSALYGGAIRFGSTGNVTNCSFTNNSARYGGAIEFDGTGNVTNCNFVDNKATSYEGGAIYFGSSGTVENCNFTNNTASNGGAIWIYSGNVTNCNFTGNNATSNGGAVYFYKSVEGNVTNCSFNNNSATKNGGAICFDEGSKGRTINCNFANNSAGYYGGAIRIHSGNVTNCNFTDNKASRSGGAVYFNEGSSGSAINCNFTNNSARYGGAIEFDGTGTVENCNFTNNSASNRGGAVYFSSSGNVTNCNFTNNSASESGGAVYFDGSSSVENCNFADNSASEGGAIYSREKYTTADTCIFKTGSDTNINTVIRPPILNVDNFITFYGSGEKLTFDLKTNSGIPVTNGNILISVYFKNNDTWVDSYSCLSGEGWTVDLPVGFYYAIFNTEYAQFQPINRTLTVTDGTTFWDLNKAINGNSNDTINLVKNYAFNSTLDSAFTEGIVINRQVTIIGNGFTIDANGKSRIFQVTANDVVLNNITFSNANTDGDGGAIYFSGSGTVENCYFADNKVTSEHNGGAIKGDNFKSINCTFINNTAFRGAALSGGEAFNCRFINNNAGQDGGAVYFGKAVDCTFKGNTARYGGAFYGNEAYNCSFVNNTAREQGGAVFRGKAVNCNFTDNHAGQGGAMYEGTAVLCILNTSSDTLHNTNLQPVFAVSKMALRFDLGDKLLFNLTYDNKNYGGYNTTITLSQDGNPAGVYYALSGCDEGWSVDLNPGVYTAKLSLEKYAVNPIAVTILSGIDGATYSELSSEIGSGRDIKLLHDYYVYDYGDIIQITEPNTIIDGDGAVIDMAGSTIRAFSVSASNVTIKNLTIKNGNYGDEGGAICFKYGSSGAVINCSFINNEVTGSSSYGGAIYISGNADVINCSFTNNSAVSEGGAICFKYGSSGAVINCSFSDNEATGSSGEAGAIYSSGNVDVVNCNFNNNIASVNGGAICISSGTVTNCNFTGNKVTASSNGGAIYSSGNVDVVNCSFTNNSAVSQGGAVRIYSGTVVNCKFVDNEVSGSGGAVYFVSNGDVVNCSFTNNSAVSYGGAICISSGTVINCSFSDNKVTRSSSHGGAVYFLNNGVVVNCSFTNNSAVYDGGAVGMSSGTVVNCKFVDNGVTGSGSYGGAVYFVISGDVVNCSFTNNSAVSQGGAVGMSSGTVVNCKFIGNGAIGSSGYGGAVYFYSNGAVTNCSFINNSAEYGNAICINYEMGNSIINDSIFINNNKNTIISRSGKNITAINSWFGNNATNYNVKPEVGKVIMDNWLFLNATANPDTLPVFTSSEICFKLFAYNESSQNVSDYDNTRLMPVNLTLTSTNGNINVSTLKLGEPVKYTADSGGIGSVTATVENVAYTIELNNARIDPNLFAAGQIFSYGENATVTLNYNPNATGKVNVTLTGKKGTRNYTNLDLNTTIILLNDIPADEYDVSVSYSGDVNFINATATATLTVTDGTTFWDLNKTINGNTNDTITLDKNYTYNSASDYAFTEGIVINRQVTIIGNGYTIDAKEKARIFKVTGNDVVLENIAFINGYTTDRSGGSAVLFGINGKVTNCNFSNNKANSSTLSVGGAINFVGEGTVTNCNFTENKATGGNSYGGAICFNSKGNVTNCKFTDNVASKMGGAVLFISFGIVTNCNFIDNKADEGGAVRFGSWGSAINCSFTNNNASSRGGAVCFFNLGNVTNCKFTDNVASKMGGAVFFGGNGNVTNCIFINNSATENGGAIYFYYCGPDSSLNDSIFINNSKTIIYVRSGDNISVINSWFGNNATNYNVKPEVGNVTMDNWLFLNATANPDTLPVFTSSDIIFKLFAYNESSQNVSDYDNTRLMPLNLTITSTNGNINVSSLKLCEPVKYTADIGGIGCVTATVENVAYTIELNNLKLDPNLFASGQIFTYGENATITLNYNLNATGKVNVTLIGKKGTINYTDLDLNSTIILPNDIPADEYDVVVSYSGDDCFINATATATLTVTDGTTFWDLNKAINGNLNDAIALDKNYTFNSTVDSAFTEGIVINKPVTINGNGYTINADGKARIFNVGKDVVLKDIIFINGNFTDFGGAIRFEEFAKLINCDFVNNTAKKGGAVSFFSNFDVINCTFTDNKAIVDNGAGGAVYFAVTSRDRDGSYALTNCNFTNNSGINGGAVYLLSNKPYVSFTVVNCKFVDNFASGQGGAAFISNSRSLNSYLLNCNFINNTAEDGGAVLLTSKIDAINCNFTNNSASVDGGAAFVTTGNRLTNCSFVDNFASNNGGAVCFNHNSNGDCYVVNCNFTGNNATSGSGIYFYKSGIKSISNSIFLNNRANADADAPLEIIKMANNIEITFIGQNNLLNAIYSSEDVDVENVTYWGVNGISNTGNSTIALSRSQNESGQNITVIGVINGNVLNVTKVTNAEGKIVLEDATGEYYIIVRHVADLYYTQAEKISTNMKYCVNVTSQTTNNKTVNITAKSNLYNEVMPGELLFIIPNTNPINASYAGNGTWWAVHTFDDYAEYDVNASYLGLDNVTINNATITITKANSTITLDDVVMNFTDSISVTVIVEGATGITAKIDDDDVSVAGYTIPISGLNAGNHNLTITTMPDEDHVSVNKTVKITVNKVDSNLTVGNIVFDYDGTGSTVVLYAGATGVNASVVGQPNANVSVDANTIAVSNLNVGNYTLTVTTIADANHNNVTKTVNITVNINNNMTFTIEAVSVDYPENVTITVNSSVDGIAYVKVSNNAGYSKEFNITVQNGAGNYTLSGLTPGEYQVEANCTSYGYNDKQNSTSFKVEKGTVAFACEGTNVIYGQIAKVYVTNLPKDATGNVTVTINSKDYTGNVDNGAAVVEIPDLTAGKYEQFGVTYSGDGNYKNASGFASITVSAAGSSVSIDNISDVVYDASVEVTYDVVNKTEVTIVVKDAEGIEITTGINTTAEGKVIISGLNAGKYTINITNAENANYSRSGDEKTFNVLKAKITINPEVTGDLFVGSIVNATFKVPTDIDGMINVIIDEEPVLSFMVINGTCTIPGAYLSGPHTVIVNLTGDTNYENAVGQTTFNISKVDSQITISDITCNVGDSINVTVTIAGGDATGNVTYENTTYTVENGQTTIPVVITKAGMQSINVTYSGDEKYLNGTASKQYDAGKGATSLVLNGTSEIHVGENVTLSVTVAPALATGTVNITLEGELYGEPVAINNGVATVVIPDLANGTYVISAQYNGDENYNASNIGLLYVFVNKVDVNINVSGSEIVYGNNATITVTGFNEDATGTVIVIFDGNYTGSVENGVGTVIIPDLAVAIYTNIEVIYSGDDKYNKYSGEAVIIVNPAPSNVTIDAIWDVVYNASVEVTYAVVNKTEVTIVVKDVNGIEITTGINTSAEGKVIISGLDAGNYTISIHNAENENYSESCAEATFNVLKATITINPEVTGDLLVDSEVNVTFNVPTDIDGMVAVTIDGEPVRAFIINNGTYTIPKTYSAGPHKVIVNLTGDTNYENATGEVTFNISKVDPQIAVSDIKGNFGDIIKVNVTFAGEDATGNVTVSVDGRNVVTVPVTNATANFTLSGLGAGNHKVSVVYSGDDKYSLSEINASFTVNKASTKLSAKKVTATYNVKKNLVITLKDSNGNSVSGVKVSVKIKKTKTYTTDKNGQVKVNVAKLVPKKYTAKISFAGNANYTASSAEAKVTVKKAKPKIVAKKKSFKKSKKVKKYTITLKNNKGKPIKKAKVTLKVKGKTYKAKTNKKGKATFKIKNLKKKGTFKAVIKYKGNKYYKKLTKKVKIKVKKSLYKTVSKGSKDTVTIKKIQQALKDHGYYTTYKGKYLKVDGKYNDCTVRSIKQFQKDHGLKVTGKADEKTAKKLGII